ncbi:MAG: thioredoxin family protein [Candidatus Kapaibacterium sp.]
MQEIYNSDILEEAAGGLFSLIYFSTPDCNVCKALKPKVNEMANNYPNLKLYYADLSKIPEASGRFNVFAVPTIILITDGREAARFSRHFSMADLEKSIQRYNSLIFE